MLVAVGAVWRVFGFRTSIATTGLVVFYGSSKLLVTVFFRRFVFGNPKLKAIPMPLTRNKSFDFYQAEE